MKTIAQIAIASAPNDAYPDMALVLTTDNQIYYRSCDPDAKVDWRKLPGIPEETDIKF